MGLCVQIYHGPGERIFTGQRNAALPRNAPLLYGKSRPFPMVSWIRRQPSDNAPTPPSRRSAPAPRLQRKIRGKQAVIDLIGYKTAFRPHGKDHRSVNLTGETRCPPRDGPQRRSAPGRSAGNSSSIKGLTWASAQHRAMPVAGLLQPQGCSGAGSPGSQERALPIAFFHRGAAFTRMMPLDAQHGERIPDPGEGPWGPRQGQHVP